MPSGPRPPSSAARAIFAGIIASTTIVTSGAFVVSLSLHTTSRAVGPLDGVALFLGLVILWVVRMRWSGLPARRADESADGWWRENAGAALLLWALLELAAMLGAVTLFATGHLIVFAVLAMLVLTGFVVLTPGRLSGGGA